jgi:hypothetical protein
MGRKEQRVYASKRQIVTFVIAASFLVVACEGWQHYLWTKRAEWPSARVTLSDFRTLPIEAIESQRGSKLLYQAEAKVEYVVNGKTHSRWLPILSKSDDKQSLQFEFGLLRRTACYVHWDQAQPDSAFLTCDRVRASR